MGRLRAFGCQRQASIGPALVALEPGRVIRECLCSHIGLTLSCVSVVQPETNNRDWLRPGGRHGLLLTGDEPASRTGHPASTNLMPSVLHHVDGGGSRDLRLEVLSFGSQNRRVRQGRRHNAISSTHTCLSAHHSSRNTSRWSSRRQLVVRGARSFHARGSHTFGSSCAPAACSYRISNIHRVPCDSLRNKKAEPAEGAFLGRKTFVRYSSVVPRNACTL